MTHHAISPQLLSKMPEFVRTLVAELGPPPILIFSTEFSTLVWDLEKGFELIVDVDSDVGLASAAFCVEEERYDVLADDRLKWRRSSWGFLAPRILDYGRQLGAIPPRESGDG